MSMPISKTPVSKTVKNNPNSNLSTSKVIEPAKAPFQITSGYCELFRHVDPNDYMWEGDGDRKVVQSIKFQAQMQRPPVVLLSLTGIDVSKGQNLRFALTATNVTQTGFDACFSVWSDTKIASAQITWVAISESAASRVDFLTGGSAASSIPPVS